MEHQFFAGKHLSAESQVEGRGCCPIQSDSIIDPMPSEESSVQQRTLGEVVVVWVKFVQVTDLRGKAPHPGLKTLRERSSLYPGIFKVLLEFLVL